MSSSSKEEGEESLSFHFDNDDLISECSTICTIDDSIPSSSSSSSSSSQEVRKVRFSQNAYCRYTISRYEITLEEAKRTWIFEDEMKSMMRNYTRTAERMKSGKTPKRNSSYRGLECFNDPDAELQSETIKSCVDAVLDEQQKRWEDEVGDANWDAISRLSKKYSKDTKKSALTRAKEDARDAKKAYRRMELSPSERNSIHSARSYSARTFALPETLKAGNAPRSKLKMDSSAENSLDSQLSAPTAEVI